MGEIHIAAFLAAASVLAFFLGYDLTREKEDSYISELMKRKKGNKSWKEAAEKIGPHTVKYLPILNLKNIENNLIWAGKPYGLTPLGFVGLKVIFLAMGTILGFVLMAVDMPFYFLFITMALTYFIPDSFLRSKVQKRKAEIDRRFPDMVSILSTALKAGIELGPGLELIGKRFPGALGDEMRTGWKEMATGRPRGIAMRDLSKRTGVSSVERFFDTIISAEERGSVDITTLIDEFRTEILESQKRRAREAAKKVPTKMLLPMFVCVFIPTILIILVPAMLSLLEVL